MSEPATSSGGETSQTERRILDAVLVVLAAEGISGLSMRTVSREAGVALGLINYHFDDKRSLIAAALRRLGEEDARLVESDPDLDAAGNLRGALRRVADPEFLATDYLGLRLQLWSLSRTDPLYGEINHEAQLRYRSGLARLIAAARPELAPDEVDRRAADILVIQNGMWLTSILIVDHESIVRSIERCDAIAFG